MDDPATPFEDEQIGSPEPYLHEIARALARQAIREAVSNWENRSDNEQLTNPEGPLNPHITDRK